MPLAGAATAASGTAASGTAASDLPPTAPPSRVEVELQRGAVVMVGVVIMMIIAAILEAFPRQLVDGTGPRFLIGGTMLAFWLAYFFLYRPKRLPEDGA